MVKQVLLFVGAVVMGLGSLMAVEGEPAPRGAKEPVIKEAGEDQEVEFKALSEPNISTTAPIADRYLVFGPARPDHPGFKWGDLTLHPIADADMMYNSNIVGAVDGSPFKKGTWIGTIKPGVEMFYRPSRNVTVHAMYQFGWHDYMKEDFGDVEIEGVEVERKVKDYLSHEALFDLQAKDVGMKGLSFGLTDKYHQTSNPGLLEDSYALFNGYAVQLARMDSNTLSPQIGYECGRHKVKALYEHGWVDYFGRLLSYQDYWWHRIGAEYSYRIDRTVSVYATYGWTRYFLHDAIEEGSRVGTDYDTHDARVGVRAQITKKLYVDFNIGQGWSVTRTDDEDAVEDHEEDSNNALSTALRVNYFATKKVSFYGAAGHEFRHEVLAGANTVIYGELGMGIIPMSKLRIDIMGRVVNEDRENYEQTTWQAGVRAGYQVLSCLDVFGQYTHSLRSKDYRREILIARPDLIGQDKVTIDEAGVGVRFKW